MVVLATTRADKSAKRVLRRRAEAEKGFTTRSGMDSAACREGVHLRGRVREPPPAEQIQRCKLLVIPPAWEQVWICPVPNGHLQAVGTDDAGRRQYLYHEQWRLKRDRLKHDKVPAIAARLPRRGVLWRSICSWRECPTSARWERPSGFLILVSSDRRRGVRGDQQQLRSGNDPEGARHHRGRSGDLQLRRQVRSGAVRGARR